MTTADQFRELVQEGRVHGTVYTDPAIFNFELDRIWARTWVYVAHESEVREPGAFVRRNIGKEPIIVSRGKSGELSVLLNRCPHRGNTVCQNDSGQTTTFRCDYHGWSFRTNGEALGVTFSDRFGENFDKTQFNMGRVPRVDTYQGFIFASLAPTGESLVEHLGQAAHYLDYFVSMSPTGEIDLGGGGHLKSRIRATWKMPLENAVDAYHPLFLHHSAFKSRKREGVSLEESYGGGDSLIRTRDLSNGHAMIDFSGVNRAVQGDAVGNSGITEFGADVPQKDQEDYVRALKNRLGEEVALERLKDGLANVVIFPNLAFVRQDVRIITPISVSETHLIQTPARLVGAPDSINAARIRTEVVSYGPMGFIGPDDIEVYERNHAGMQASWPEWVVLSRGLNQEVQKDGYTEGAASDETPQRAIWKRYAELMVGDSDGPAE